MSRRLTTLFSLFCIALIAWFLARATFALRETALETSGSASRACGKRRCRARAARRLRRHHHAQPPRGLRLPTRGPPLPKKRYGCGFRRRKRTPFRRRHRRATRQQARLETARDHREYGAGKASRAVIQVNGAEQPYREGDTIQGWKIALVQRRTVVVAKGGSKERLLMSEDPILQKEDTKPDEQKTVSRARLREELGDVGSLMRAVSVSPQTVGGYQGLRILDMQSGSYIEELGLRKDDLLLGANGKPLRGFGDLGGLGDLADKSAITLEILRNGKKTIIRYDVQS